MGLASKLITYPSGSSQAKIVVVAARPGKHEVGLCYCRGRHQVGIGLVGPSGELVWKLLGNHGICRDDCYVTNVRKDFSDEHAVPTDHEIAEVLDELQRELAATSANVIVALGREALFALCGKSTIEPWRGSILESTLLPGRKVISTWHPAATFRRPEWVYVIDADLKRAAQQAVFPDIRRTARTFIIDPPVDEGIDRLKNLGQRVSTDIECFGNAVSCIGVSDWYDFAMCIPIIGGQNTTADKVYLVRELDWTLRSKMLVGQNFSMFDQRVLRGNGYGIGHVLLDSMLAHHLLYPELGMKSKTADDLIEKYAGSHDLAFLVSMYTEEPYYKHLGKDWYPDWNQYWTYNCLDAACTFEVCFGQDGNSGLYGELVEFGQWNYYERMVNALANPVLAMQDRGLAVDHEKLAQVRKRNQLEMDYLQAILNNEVGFPCNVRSTIDMRHLIYDVLKHKRVKSTKKGALSTDEDTILQLAYKSPHADLFRLIIDIRERRTIQSGFLQLEVNDAGRYAALYKLHGTDSGRLSSTSPRRSEGRRGPQLQNIPERARIVFVAGAGRKLMVSDLRRAEAMFVAYDSGDEGLIEIFNDPSRDLYKEEAAYSLGRALEAITKFIRDIFKQVIHATHYGMRGPGLVSHLRLKGIYIEDLEIKGITAPNKKGEYLIQSYLQRHKAIKDWQDEVWSIGRATRVLHDGLGRRRFFMGRMDEHMQRVMLSFRPQATVVGVTNKALIDLHHQGWDVVLQVHDSIGIEVDESRIVECAVAMEDALTCPIELHGRTLVIPTDTKYGKGWGALDGIVAPDVLKLYRETRSARAVPLLGGDDDTECRAGPEGILQ
jgi:uracil-DNA glycosylase family 4